MTDYISLANEVGKLVEQKQKAYGDSFNRSELILKVLYPDGIKPENYKDLLAITRMIDKLFRISTKNDPFGESPYRDLVGYSLLGLANDEELKRLSGKKVMNKLKRRAKIINGLDKKAKNSGKT